MFFTWFIFRLKSCSLILDAAIVLFLAYFCNPFLILSDVPSSKRGLKKNKKFFYKKKKKTS